MASQKFGFVTVDPVSGQGTQAVSISGDVNTGRNQRTQNLQATAPGVSDPKALQVIQAGASEVVTVTSATATVEKTGGNLTITGKSNSTDLTFSYTQGEENPLTIELPAQYTANGGSTDNGAAVSGDPGATAEYDWSITITGIAENTTINELTGTLTVTPNGGSSLAKTVAITQAAGDPFLTLDKDTINLNAAGDAQTVNVDSNTTWSFAEASMGVLRAMLQKAKK